MKKLTFFCFLMLLTFHSAYGDKLNNCRANVTQLESGVYELNLGSVKIKTENYNQIAKMKLVGEVNEEWNSVQTDQGISEISGFLGNGEKAELLAELISSQESSSEGISYVLFNITDKQNHSGTAYFFSKDTLKCTQANLSTWTKLKDQIVGAIVNKSSVNLEPDGFR